jgi:hypothetical protein
LLYIYMNEPDRIELNIEISAGDATEDDIDRMTRQLLSELREMDIDSAELAKGGSASITVGSIVISFFPNVLSSVISLVQTWMSRGQGRTVKFKGKGIEFEGSPEELQKLLGTLEKGKKKNRLAGDSTTDAPPPKKD